MTDAWLHIGRVVAVNAARRQLRISAMPGCECEFDGRDRLWLASGADTPGQARIAGIRRSGAEVIVELTPGMSRDMTAGLKNTDVMLPAASSNRKGGANTSLHQLSGLRMVTTAGDFVGSVTETQDTPGGGIMRLQCANAVMATAPVTEAFIREIDLDAGIVVVNDPDYFLVVDEDGRGERSSRKAAQD